MFDLLNLYSRIAQQLSFNTASKDFAMLRKIGSHLMVSDDGKCYEVEEFQDFIDTSTMDGRSEMGGMKELRLIDGSRVNFMDKNTFQIVQTGQIIRRG